jgi:hypothetical protein
VQQSLIEAIKHSQADYIIPTDDRAIWQLHALASSHPEYRDLVVDSLGDASSFSVVRSRVSLINLADSLNISTPTTVSLGSEQEAASYSDSWNYPAVVKRDGSSGGRGVYIAKDAVELVSAYRQLHRNTSIFARIKRRLVDDDVLAFSRSWKILPNGVSLQSFVDGTPANAMYSCFRGKLLRTIQVRTVCAQHATGAALIVERIDDPRIEDAGRKLAKALCLSGFFGLDFLLEASTGVPHLLEMNPRATQLGHLPVGGAGDGRTLVEALWLAWRGDRSQERVIDAENNKIPQRIAFYPNALVLGENNPLLSSAWLDCPDDEPNLVRELSKMGWPERSAVYRFFHRFYKISPDKPVVFEDVETRISRN